MSREIPEGWTSTKLKELLLKTDSGAWGEEGTINDTPVLRSTNITNYGQMSFEKLALRKLLGKDKLDYLMHGDILIEKSGGSNDWSVGRVVYFDKKEGHYYFANFMQRIRINPKKAFWKYIFYFLFDFYKQGGTKNLFQKTTGIQNLRINEYLLQGILLPPLPEQQKIVAILSSVDEAIEKTKAIIEQTKIVKIGLMQTLFTRGLPGRHKKFKKTVIGEIPKEWPVAKVGDVCAYIVPGRNKPKIFDGEIPWITTPDIIGRQVKTSQMSLSVSSDEIKRCGTRTVPEGSVIMSCVGEFGVVTISAHEMVINQQLHAFIPPEDLDANFLRYCLILQKPYMEKIATKTAVPYMNKFNCNSIPIPKPSIHEQKEIADVLLSIETKMEIEQTLLTNLHYIKNALMQVLLTGAVRVKIT